MVGRRRWRDRSHRGQGSPPQWGRTRLGVVLLASTCAVLAVLVGLGWLVVDAVTGTHGRAAAFSEQAGQAPASAPASGGVPGETTAQRRDRLAADPLPEVSLDAAKPQPLSSQVARVLYVPAGTGVDQHGVATGFPPTAQGALGQLAAIDRAAISSGGPAQARAVIGAWAAAGGPTAQTWSGVRAMTSLYDAAGLPAGDTSARIDYAPSMGVVKATDGPGWVVVCVNGTLTVTLAQTARVAASDCQRMVWDDDRWVVVPGREPAGSPSAWPGSQVAIDVGWLELRDE